MNRSDGTFKSGHLKQLCEIHPVWLGSLLRRSLLWMREEQGFCPKENMPLPDTEHTISIADFAVPEKRLAIYIDGAAFLVGRRLRRERLIRERLRTADPACTVVDLRVEDLKSIGSKIPVEPVRTEH